MYRLKEAKLIKGRIASTRMDWLCAEITGKRGEDTVMCVDITLLDRPDVKFSLPKGEPPLLDDFAETWFSQVIQHDWDKLRDGNLITVSDEAEEKIRQWRGRLYLSGGVSRLSQVGNTVLINRENISRELGRAEEAPAIVFPDEEMYDKYWREINEG